MSGGECGREPHQRRNNWPAQKLYTLRTKEGWHSFHKQLAPQKIWGYDGILPGPTFVARYGEPIIVRNYNELPSNSFGFGSPEISTHLHNLHCASESDGYAGDWYSADPLKGKGTPWMLPVATRTTITPTAMQATTRITQPTATRVRPWGRCGTTTIGNTIQRQTATGG